MIQKHVRLALRSGVKLKLKHIHVYIILTHYNNSNRYKCEKRVLTTDKIYGIYRQTLLHLLPEPYLHNIGSIVQYSLAEGQVLYRWNIPIRHNTVQSIHQSILEKITYHLLNCWIEICLLSFVIDVSHSVVFSKDTLLISSQMDSMFVFK